MEHNIDASTANASGMNVSSSTRKLTDYQLVRIIGTGTFGKVYLAIHNG